MKLLELDERGDRLADADDDDGRLVAGVGRLHRHAEAVDTHVRLQLQADPVLQDDGHADTGIQ